MDNQQPGRGQQKIVINHPPRSSSPADAAAGCGCLVLILLVAFFHGIFSGSSTSDSIDDTSTASDNSNTPISSPYNSDQPLLTSNLTSVTRPGGSYAAFVPASETVSEAFLFKEDFLEIHVVQNENEIPSNDRVAAMRPQRNGQDTSYVPKFDPTFKGIQFPSGPYHAIDNSRPVVFYGGVDIIAGPIAEHDQWTAEYQAVNGNVVNIRTLYDGTKLEEVRGPPKARRVYIVGHVRKAKTPEAFDASKVNVAVMSLDLRPEESVFAQYRVARDLEARLRSLDPTRDPYRSHTNSLDRYRPDPYGIDHPDPTHPSGRYRAEPPRYRPPVDVPHPHPIAIP